MLALKRARPRLALFAAMFGVVFLLAGLSVGLSGYLAGSATAGARAGLGALTGSSGAFRITIPLASNPAAQDARVRSEIAHGVTSDGRPVPLRIVGDIETLAALELDGPRGVARSALASIPELANNATLVAGHWPTSAAQASVQADAAAALGVRLGDQFSLPGGARVIVVATWRVRDASDPIWLGSGITLTGLGYGGVAGFFVIDPSLWANVAASPVARWTVLPRSELVTASQLSALQRAPDTAPVALLADARNGTSVDQDGRIQPALIPIVTNVQAAAAVSIAPVVIVAVLGLVTLLELAGMLTQFRETETRLLRARGITRQLLMSGAALEGAIVALPAAALGAVVAAAILPLLQRAGSAVPTGWIGALAAAIMAIAVMALSAGMSAPDSSSSTARRGERIRGATQITAFGLTVLAAIVAVTQFLLYGSPLTNTATGGVDVDPLAVTAPALALVALSLVGLALFPLVSRLAERVARRSVGLGSLPVRQLARRARPAVTPMLLVALAVAGLVFSATYSGTWQASSAETRAVQVGAAVRVTGLPAAATIESRAVPGVLASAPGQVGDMQIGNSLVPVVELPRARIRDVVTPVANSVNAGLLARMLSDPVARPRLATGASAITVSVHASPARAAPIGVDVTVVDALGALTTVRGSPHSGGFFAPLPRGTAPWVVRAIDLQFSRAPENSRVSVTLSTGSNQIVPLGNSWTLSDLGAGHPGFATLAGPNPGVRMTVPTEGARVRLQPKPKSDRVPLVISASLAQSAGLHVGGLLDVPLFTSGGDLPATVVGIVPVIPGATADDGVLTDLGAVQDAVLRAGLNNTAPTEWWIATNDPRAVSRWLDSRVPVGAVVETRDAVPADAVLRSANNIVWISAIAIALLGMLAVAAGLIAEVRVRNDQVSLLRALGLGRRVQARGRVIEIGTLLGLGLIAGILDGTLVSALIVPDLARTAIPDALAALPTVLTLDVAAGLVSLASVVVVAGAILAATAGAVRRQAGMAVAEGRG